MRVTKEQWAFIYKVKEPPLLIKPSQATALKIRLRQFLDTLDDNPELAKWVRAELKEMLK